MKPELGFKTWDMFNDREGVPGLNMPVIEITPKDRNFNFRKKALDKIKDRFSDKDLSMHTGVKRMFSKDDKLLEEFKLQTLRAEVLACSYLDINQLIIHLKQEKLSDSEADKISDIIDFAGEEDVEMLYEPNGNFVGENYLYNLDKLGVNANLDLCHLAMAVENSALGMDLDSFLERVKDRVVYVHASNYNGENEHVGLDKGNLDWRHVLDKLDLGRIKKIIIELHHFGHFEETKDALEEFLSREN